MENFRQSSSAVVEIQALLAERPRATMRPHSAVARLRAPDMLDRSGARAAGENGWRCLVAH